MSDELWTEDGPPLLGEPDRRKRQHEALRRLQELSDAEPQPDKIIEPSRFEPGEPIPPPQPKPAEDILRAFMKGRAKWSGNITELITALKAFDSSFPSTTSPKVFGKHLSRDPDYKVTRHRTGKKRLITIEKGESDFEHIYRVITGWKG